MDKTVSYIYLIGPETGPTKIGHSDVPQSRLRQLQPRHTERLFLFGEWPVGKRIVLAVERYIHWTLRDKLYRGEWFNVSRSEAEAAIEAGIAAADQLNERVIVPPVDLGKRRSKLKA